jgi:hypothetical protein
MKFIHFKKQVIFFSLAFLFLGCEDKSYLTTVYNKNLLNKQYKCLDLKLSPYSNKIYNNIKNIYPFSNNCENILKISYKSNIGCNSPYNKNKSLNSFIELELSTKDHKVISIYKDLKDANISEEIKKGYKQLCKKIKI